MLGNLTEMIFIEALSHTSWANETHLCTFDTLLNKSVINFRVHPEDYTFSFTEMFLIYLRNILKFTDLKVVAVLKFSGLVP